MRTRSLQDTKARIRTIQPQEVILMKAISKPFAKLAARLKRRNINIMDLLMKLLAGFGV